MRKKTENEMLGLWRKPAAGGGGMNVKLGCSQDNSMVPGEQHLGKKVGRGLTNLAVYPFTVPLRTTRTEQQSAPLCVAFYFVALSSSQDSTQYIPKKSQEGFRVSTHSPPNCNISEAQERWLATLTGPHPAKISS